MSYCILPRFLGRKSSKIVMIYLEGTCFNTTFAVLNKSEQEFNNLNWYQYGLRN